MTVEKTSKGYQIRLESGKLMPKAYSSKEEAEKRIAQMEQFKHMKENLAWNLTDVSITEADGQKLKITGTAVAEETSRNGKTYTVTAMKENHMMPFNVIVGHKEDWDNPDHNVGEGKYHYQDGLLKYEAIVMNTSHHPDIVEQTINHLVAPSVQGKAVIRKSGSNVLVEQMRIPILALVNKHTRGIESASIDGAVAESLAKYDEEIYEAEQAEVAKMAELDELKLEVAKLTEALHSSEEDKKKMKAEHDDMMKKEKEKMMMKEAEDKKKKLVESIRKSNAALNESELLSKSVEVLEVMESYERKAKNASAAAVSEHEDLSESEELKGIVIAESDRSVTMDAERYSKFNKEIASSIYR